MRIFYVGELNDGGTCLDRLRCLRRLGHEVVGFNIIDHWSRWRAVNSLRNRLQPRVLLADLNRQVMSAIRQWGSCDIAWIDRGVSVYPETVLGLKRHAGRVVHFTPDPQLLYHRSRHFVRSIPLYDHVITTKTFEVEYYQRANAQSIILSQQSFSPDRYSAPRRREQFIAELGFIGHFEPHYGRLVKLASHDYRIRAWGRGWSRARRLRGVPPDVVQGEGLWETDYVDALASFQIGLGFLTKLVPEQHTTRTFEIPAAGTFLLAERTGEHLQFFDEGKEAEYFDSNDEFISKAEFYLRHPSSRKRIAENGRNRCFKSGYDVDSVLARVLSNIT